MYAREASRETRSDVLIKAMRDIKLCAMVSTTSNGLNATHLPVLIEETGSGDIILNGHMSRNNDHWRVLTDGAPSIAIFQGPHSYITPSWYETKQLTGKVVPTWAYIAVHAHGKLKAITDQEWLRAHVTALTDTHERSQPQPWAVSDAPDNYITTMLRGIIGVQMHVDRLEGSWKLNQHRSTGDQQGVISALEDSSDPRQNDLAVAMPAGASALTKG